MQPFARPLGDAAKKARAAINLTQRQVAGRIGADARSVLNIENYKGNPSMHIFAVEACDEALAEALLPVVESVLKILHEKNAAKSGGIARNQKSLPFPKGQQTLSVMGPFLRLASF